MRIYSVTGLSLAALLSLSVAGHSAIITEHSVKYGNEANGLLLWDAAQPNYGDPSNPNLDFGSLVGVPIRFEQLFDLNSTPWRIDGAKVTVVYRDVNPVVSSEMWSVNGTSLDNNNTIGVLPGTNDAGWQTASFDLTGAVLQSVIDTRSLTLWFNEYSTHIDTFRLRELNVRVASVPVPAAGVLLMGALGGLAMLRRRKTAQKA